MSETATAHNTKTEPMTRRDFLKLSAATAGGAVATTIFGNEVDASSHFSVVLDGVKQIEVGGKKYQLDINPEPLYDMIMKLVSLLNDPSLPPKVTGFLPYHTLHLEVASLPPAIRGRFKPPEDFPDHQPRIQLNLEALPVYSPLILQEAQVDSDETVLAHEILHMIKYIQNPEKILNQREHARSRQSDYLRQFMFRNVLAGIVFGGIGWILARRLGLSEKRRQAVTIGAAVGANMHQAQEGVTETIVGTQKVMHDDDFDVLLVQAFQVNDKLRALNKSIFQFSEVP